MIKVSVIVPVFNSEKYLRKCLDSLINQTLSEIEILVIDDGSTDSSHEIIEQYCVSYPTKVHMITKKNGGQGRARNLGIKHAVGKFIGFVDSDDYVDHTMFEYMYEEAIKTKSDYLECNYCYLTEGGKLLKQYGSLKRINQLQDMFINPLVSPWNKLVLKDLLIENQIEFPEGVIYEDLAFYAKLIPYIKNPQFINKAFVYHIKYDSSTMNSNRGEKVGDIFKVIENIVTIYKNNEKYSQYKSEIEYLCTKILLCSSLKRISKIEDKAIRNSYIKQTINILKNYFEGYRQNPYMNKSIKGHYLKLINRFTILPYAYILQYF